jgi:hypothetical protein
VVKDMSKQAQVDERGRLFFNDPQFGRQIIETGSRNSLRVVENFSDLPNPKQSNSGEIYHVSSEANYYKSNGSSWIQGNSLSQDLNDAISDAELYVAKMWQMRREIAPGCGVGVRACLPCRRSWVL